MDGMEIALGGDDEDDEKEEAPVESKDDFWSNVKRGLIFLACTVLGSVSPWVKGLAKTGCTAGRPHYPFQKNALIIGVQLTSIGASLFITRVTQGGWRQVVKLIFSRPVFLALAPVGISFGFADLLELMVIDMSNPVLYMCLSQLKLPIAAALARVVTGKSQSCTQWLRIFDISFLCVVFELIGMHDGASARYTGFRILLVMALKNTLQVLGSLWAEKGFANVPDITLWVNQVHFHGFGLATNLFLILYTQPEEMFDAHGRLSVRRLFGGWDRYTWLMLLVMVFYSLVVAEMAKRFSTINKFISFSLSLSLLQVLTYTCTPSSHCDKRGLADSVFIPSQGLVGMLICSAALGYAVASVEPAPAREEKVVEMAVFPQLPPALMRPESPDVTPRPESASEPM